MFARLSLISTSVTICSHIVFCDYKHLKFQNGYVKFILKVKLKSEQLPEAVQFVTTEWGVESELTFKFNFSKGVL